MKKCIFNGSFDPITNGHVDVVKRALGIFDEVVIAVMQNSEKNSLFSLRERVDMIKLAFGNDDRVKVHLHGGLTIDLCKELDIYTVIRGVRNTKDFEYEANLDIINKKLLHGFETIFFPTRQELYHVSSSFIRELLKYQGDITPFVPIEVSDYITALKK